MLSPSRRPGPYGTASQPRLYYPTPDVEFLGRSAGPLPRAAPARITHAPGAEHLGAAIAQLWAPFEEAVAQANNALFRWGLEDRLAIERIGSQRWISIAGPGGRDGAISVLITAHARDGQIAGGAVLTTSQLRTAIFVAPMMEASEVRLRMPSGCRLWCAR
jgi:hypothetical protein